MVKRINTDGNYGKIMGKGGTYRGEYIEREIRIDGERGDPSQRRDHQGSLTCCSPGFPLEIYRYYTPAVFVSRKTPGDLPGPRLFSNIFPPFSLPLPPALTPTPSIGL